MKRVLFFVTVFSWLISLGVSANAEGTAPVAENLELTTYRNVSVGGQFSAYDPDGNVADYEITTQPVKGSIQKNKDGSFVYTPCEDKKGRDYFGYKAIDADGNYSQEATVIIKIEKQKKDVSYFDVDGTPEEYYAVALSEAGIYTGEQIGNVYCFEPEHEVKRGEFISMCMMAADEPVVSSVMNTGFTDDESIREWMKPFVLAAAIKGIDTGNKGAFYSDAPISREEAVVTLNKVLRMNNVKYMELDSELEHETAQACANLNAVGITCEGTLITEGLTRIEAAQLLVNAMKVISKR